MNLLNASTNPSSQTNHQEINNAINNKSTNINKLGNNLNNLSNLIGGNNLLKKSNKMFNFFYHLRKSSSYFRAISIADQGSLEQCDEFTATGSAPA